MMKRMPEWVKQWALVFTILVVTGALTQVIVGQAQPQGVKDFGPYKFAEVPEESGVYKMVYQGCEIFVAVDRGSTGEISFKSYPKSVSIATGRNCR